MQHRLFGAVVAAILIAASPRAWAAADKLVYVDFERVENGRPVSARGGAIDLWSYEEDKVHKSTFKGAAVDPPAPELVRVKADDPNHAGKFDYALEAPNRWAGVAIEIHGLPDASGVPQSDDVSVYKFLSLQVYATGIRILKLETRSNESGKDTLAVHPMMTFAVKPGLNTYRVPLSGFTQPAGTELRVDPKNVLKKLTSIALIAFCDQCEQIQQGIIVIDNVVFEK